MQNHLEISLKEKSVLDPKHAKLDQKSDFGHVRTPQTSPGGQVLVSKASFCLYFLRNYTFPFFINKFIMFFWNSFVLLSEFIIFMKSSVLSNKFIIFRVLIATPRLYFLILEILRLLYLY